MAYTWSKSITDNGSDRSNSPRTSTTGAPIVDFLCSTAATCSPRRMCIRFRLREQVCWICAGRWEVSGIVTYNSGLPLTVNFLAR